MAPISALPGTTESPSGPWLESCSPQLNWEVHTPNSKAILNGHLALSSPSHPSQGLDTKEIFKFPPTVEEPRRLRFRL